MKNTFETDNQLLIGILYDSIQTYDSFVHVKSVFSDKWYNFIVPSVVPAHLDWAQVQKIRDSENGQGVGVSFYVPDYLLAHFKEYFKNKNLDNNLGSDFGVYVDSKKSNGGVGKIEEVTDTNMDEYIRMVKSCFPDWSNNEAYSRYFHNLQKDGTMIKNFMYQVDQKNIGFGSLVASKSLNLAYIHNTGILPEYRRKGYFTDLIGLITSYALDCGASTSFALVEADGASHKALQKIGFVTRTKYYLFEIG